MISIVGIDWVDSVEWDFASLRFKMALPWTSDLDVMHHNNGLDSYNCRFRMTALCESFA